MKGDSRADRPAVQNDPVERDAPVGRQMLQGRLAILAGGLTPRPAVTDAISPVIYGISRMPGYAFCDLRLPDREDYNVRHPARPSAFPAVASAYIMVLIKGGIEYNSSGGSE